MLVLTRRYRECIRIGKQGEIVVKVLTGGRPIRLGIEAPADIPVDRDEVFSRKQENMCNTRKTRKKTIKQD